MLNLSKQRRTETRPRIRPKRTYIHKLTMSAQAKREPLLPRHRIAGAVLAVVAVALVPTHLITHYGALDLLPNNLEDLLLGFPMSGVLGIAALVAFIWR